MEEGRVWMRAIQVAGWKTGEAEDSISFSLLFHLFVTIGSSPFFGPSTPLPTRIGRRPLLPSSPLLRADL